MINIKKYKITKRGKITVIILFVIILFLIIQLFMFIKSSFGGYINVKNTNHAEKIVTSDKPKTKDNFSGKDDVKNIDVKQEELSIPVEEAYFNDGKKIAFLTFDDGPSDNTNKILDILNNYKIKATFFIIGSNAEKNPDTLKRIYNEGHAIGNHTYSHDYDFLYSNVDNFIGEVNRTEEVLKQYLGDSFFTRMVRFPGGSFGGDRKPYRDELVNEGFAYIDWNAVNGDGDGTNIPEEQLVNQLESTTGKQKHIVVLMHDSATKSTSVEALPDIIEYLKNQGYEFAILK